MVPLLIKELSTNLARYCYSTLGSVRNVPEVSILVLISLEVSVSFSQSCLEIYKLSLYWTLR